MIRIQCFQITIALATHSSMILPRNLKEYMYVNEKYLGLGVDEWLTWYCHVSVV